eukprot:gene8558-10896_t
MEVATGEIRAMANLTKRPDDKYEEVFNYALAGSTDPGSTFKLPTMMALLEETKMDPNKVTVNTGKGSIRFRGLSINDSKRGGHGILTAAQQWNNYSLTFMSYGYEMRMTPLQTLAMYNAVANDGYWVRPMV